MKTVVTHGKCILLGEHSVVRGHPALVFPLASRELSLSWWPEGQGFEGALAEPLRRCLEKVGAAEGRYQATSTIPSRAGLGSSAALSVAVCRMAEAQGRLQRPFFEQALELENLFHGKSSGIDLAAVMAEQPLAFRQGKSERLSLRWHPRLCLSDTGLRSSTKACVEKVQALQAPELDERMSAAVLRARAALSAEESVGLPALAEALREGQEVFRQWGLVPTEAHATVEKALGDGALAAKVSGSGDGGFVLSLWASPPPAGYTPISADSSPAP